MSPVSARQFFEALYEGVGAGFIEVRPLLDDDDPRKNTPEGKKLQAQMRRWFHWPSETLNCVKYCSALNGRDFHLYYGVALRRERGVGNKEGVACCTAVFCDVDFKDVDPETVRRLLNDFPLKPSAIVKSGHGLHIYWFLKEPVMASGFPRLEGFIRAMLRYLRAQVGPQDVSRILRVVGTVNIKLKYPDPKPVTEVCHWHPERRYTLDDFEKFVKAEAPPAGTPHHAAAGAPAADGPPEPSAYELSDKIIERCAELLSTIWGKGTRHFISLHVAGWCAHANYSENSAHRLIARICEMKADAESADRQQAVTDTYKKHLAGHKVAGFRALETVFKEELSRLSEETDAHRDAVAEQGLKVLEIIRKSAPKVRKNDPDGRNRWVNADFRLVKIIKFNSIPAHFRVTVEKDAHDHITSCDTDVFFSYPRFQKAVYEQNDVVLVDLKDPQWHRMISIMKAEQREAPKEARPDGAIDSALNEFLQEAKENPDLGLLKSFPGYDETTTFFRFEALKDFLQTNGQRFNETKIFDRLKALGWESKVRRFGKKTPLVWYRNTSSNGNGHTDGDTPGTGPSDPAHLPGFDQTKAGQAS